MIKKIKLLLLFIITANILQAQESPFVFLRGNAEIIEYRKHLPKQNTQILNKTQSTSTVSLILPFYDEFSYPGPYPDPAKWQNSQSVYVNRTKAIAPPTMGVATFDGLNKYGYPYDDSQTITCFNSGNGLTNHDPSDTLTSLPIRLDSIPPSQGLAPVDSIYLSFYYQPKGYFEAPESGDDLFLDLYSPLDSTWNNVWTKGGYNPTDSSWHLVMIPIIDAAYFHKNFQFRFRNLSSTAGDIDHWHIDVVSLRSNPHGNKDTIFPDHTFAYDLSSTLKNYTQMPYQQYSGATDMKPRIAAFLRNNDNYINNENVTTGYSCYDNTGGTFLNPPTFVASDNLPYYYNYGYCNNINVIDPLVNIIYPLLTDTNTYTTKFYLSPPLPDLHPTNDTTSFKQKFSNYYAYDDGSAEAGFGICSDYIAVKYTLNKPDVLRAMDIFFDPIYDVKYLETTSFRMVVWADSAGFPRTNNPIYRDTIDRYPYFAPDTVMPGTQRVNTFLRYQFQFPQPLNGGTTFYIGVIANSYNPLAIGFDRNTNFYQNMFRHTGGAWYVFPAAAISDYGGSLMMRPVLGDSLSALGIKNYTSQNKANFTLYPNPAQDFVSIQSESNIAKLVVTDLLGNTILQQTGAAIKTINTLSLQSGVYLIKAFTDKGFTDTQKLIIAR